MTPACNFVHKLQAGVFTNCPLPLLLHKTLPLVSVLSQTEQFTPSQPVSFIYILYHPSTIRCFKSSLSCRFSYQKCLHAIVFPHIRHNHCPSPSPQFDHPNYTWWEVSILYLVTVQCPQSLVSSSILGPNTLLSAIFSINFSFHSLLNANDQRFTRI
jgi:hypothetical protein